MNVVQHPHEYRLGMAIQTAYERYGPFWFTRVTIIYEAGRGYLINIAGGPRAL